MDSKRGLIELEIIDSLRVVSQYIQRYSKLLEKEFNLSSSQLRAMWAIKESSKLRVSDIAKALGIHLSTTSNMLDKIENKKLIKRKRDLNDTRSVYISLTPKGRVLLEKAPHPSNGNLANALREMTDNEVNHLTNHLTKLTSILESS